MDSNIVNGNKTKDECKENETADTSKGGVSSKTKVAGGGGDVPAHHARRPPNGFLLFCKRHRDLVSEKNPTLENRGVTKLLGNWWRMLEESERDKFKALAKKNKEIFIANNPQFTWYKLPAPPLRTLVTRPSNRRPPKLEQALISPAGPITPGKLADESQLGGLTSLLATSQPPASPPTPPPNICSSPPKKRFLQQSKAKMEDDKKKYNKRLKKNEEEDDEDSDNYTKQQLIDKIVDASFEPHCEQLQIQRNLDYITNEHTYQKNPYRAWAGQTRKHLKIDVGELENGGDVGETGSVISPNVNNNTIVIGGGRDGDKCFPFDGDNGGYIPANSGVNNKVYDCDNKLDQMKPSVKFAATQDSGSNGCDKNNLQSMLGEVSRDIECMMNENDEEEDVEDEFDEYDDYSGVDTDSCDSKESNNDKRGRLCKGRRYEQFIKSTVSKKKNKNLDNNYKNDFDKGTNLKYETSPKMIDCVDEHAPPTVAVTSAKPSDIIQMKLDLESKLESNNNNKMVENDVQAISMMGRRQRLKAKKKPMSRVQMIKENTELQSNFNLDTEIEELPLYSFDVYLEKKKIRKKKLLGQEVQKKESKHHQHRHNGSTSGGVNKLERFKFKETNNKQSYIRSRKTNNNNNNTSTVTAINTNHHGNCSQTATRSDSSDLITLAALSLLELAQLR